MDEDKIREKVKQRYMIEYPPWTDIRVTEVVVSSLSGYLAVVRAKENGQDTEGEICHISLQGKVTPFATQKS